jgi:hypothetical protein
MKSADDDRDARLAALERQEIRQRRLVLCVIVPCAVSLYFLSPVFTLALVGAFGGGGMFYQNLQMKPGSPPWNVVHLVAAATFGAGVLAIVLTRTPPLSVPMLVLGAFGLVVVSVPATAKGRSLRPITHEEPTPELSPAPVIALSAVRTRRRALGPAAIRHEKEGR